MQEGLVVSSTGWIEKLRTYNEVVNKRDALYNHVNDLQRAYDELKAEYNRIKADSESFTRAFAAEFEKARKQNAETEQLRDALAKKEAEIDMLRTEQKSRMDALNSRFTALQRAYNALQAEHSRLKTDSESFTRTFTAEFEKARKQNAETEQLRDALAKKEAQFVSQNEECEKIKKAYAELKTQYEGLLKTNKQNYDAALHYREQLKTAQAENNRLQCRNLRMSNELLSAKNAAADSHAEAKVLRDRLRKIDDEKNSKGDKKYVYSVLALSSTELEGYRYEHPSGWNYSDRDD